MLGFFKHLTGIRIISQAERREKIIAVFKFATRETKALIMDAESHYASLPIIASAAAPGATPVLSSGSSSGASSVSDSISTVEVDRMMRMVAAQITLSEQKHQAQIAELDQKHQAELARIQRETEERMAAQAAAQAAENQRIRAELANSAKQQDVQNLERKVDTRADRKEVAELRQDAKKTADTLRQFIPDAPGSEGDGLVLVTNTNFQKPTPEFLGFYINVQQIAATAEAAREAAERHEGRLDQVEGQVEAVGSRMRRTERSGFSFPSWGTFFASTPVVPALPSAPVEAQSSNNQFVDLVSKFPGFMTPSFIARQTQEIAKQRTLEAMRRAEQEAATLEAETEVVMPASPQVSLR
jgi:hypothetical protein